MIVLHLVVEVHDFLLAVYECFRVEWVVLQKLNVGIAAFLCLTDVEAQKSSHLFNRVEGSKTAQLLP